MMDCKNEKVEGDQRRAEQGDARAEPVKSEEQSVRSNGARNDSIDVGAVGRGRTHAQSKRARKKSRKAKAAKTPQILSTNPEQVRLKGVGTLLHYLLRFGSVNPRNNGFNVRNPEKIRQVRLLLVQGLSLETAKKYRSLRSLIFSKHHSEYDAAAHGPLHRPALRRAVRLPGSDASVSIASLELLNSVANAPRYVAQKKGQGASAENGDALAIEELLLTEKQLKEHGYFDHVDAPHVWELPECVDQSPHAVQNAGARGESGEGTESSGAETEQALPKEQAAYSIDCEMCLTDSGSELTRISVLNFAGATVYDTLVKPKTPIRDYLTQYSGITPEAMAGVTTTLEDVRSKLSTFMTRTTIIIGHGLENDFRALHLKHCFVVDTAIVYQAGLGGGYKPKLRHLAKVHLGWDIQLPSQPPTEKEQDCKQGGDDSPVATAKGSKDAGVKLADPSTSASSQVGEIVQPPGSHGHDSIEDALACLRLVKLKLEKGRAFMATDPKLNVFTCVARQIAHENKLALKRQQQRRGKEEQQQEPQSPPLAQLQQLQHHQQQPGCVIGSDFLCKAMGKSGVHTLPTFHDTHVEKFLYSSVYQDARLAVVESFGLENALSKRLYAAKAATAANAGKQGEASKSQETESESRATQAVTCNMQPAAQRKAPPSMSSSNSFSALAMSSDEDDDDNVDDDDAPEKEEERSSGRDATVAAPCAENDPNPTKRAKVAPPAVDTSACRASENAEKSGGQKQGNDALEDSNLKEASEDEKAADIVASLIHKMLPVSHQQVLLVVGLGQRYLFRHACQARTAQRNALGKPIPPSQEFKDAVSQARIGCLVAFTPKPASVNST